MQAPQHPPFQTLPYTSQSPHPEFYTGASPTSYAPMAGHQYMLTRGHEPPASSYPPAAYGPPSGNAPPSGYAYGAFGEQPGQPPLVTRKVCVCPCVFLPTCAVYMYSFVCWTGRSTFTSYWRSKYAEISCAWPPSSNTWAAVFGDAASLSEEEFFGD